MRATDERYLPCPICGKQPVVRFSNPPILSFEVFGDVYCRGGLFRRHKKIVGAMHKDCTISRSSLRDCWNNAVKYYM